MTDTPYFLDLAARIEAADGPDRALDAEIRFDILGFCPHNNTVRSGAQSDTGFDCVDCGADSWGNLGKRGQRLHDMLPAYTASLDAAMALLPKGYSVQSQQRRSYEYTWYGLRRDGCTKLATGQHINPAQALAAASLRARSAHMKGQDDEG